MTSTAAYEISSLDWTPLRSLAKRAAQETPLSPAPALGYINRSTGDFTDVCGPHWLLDDRYEFWEKTEDNVIEESRTEVLYVLMPDGQLVKVLITEGFTGDMEGHWHNYDDTHFVGTMTEDDVLSFDFATGYHERGEHGSPQPKVWGNSDRPGSRGALLQTTKGTGLSLLLENLCSGRAEQASGLTIRSQKTGNTRTQQLPGLTTFHHTPDQRVKAIADLQAARDQAAADQAEAARIQHLQARTREIRSAFSSAGKRAVKAAGSWLLLCSVILVSNMVSEPTKGLYGFASGSYSVVTWSLIFMVAGGLVIDIFIGEGRSGAFVAGAVFGFMLNTYASFSKPYVDQHPVDISMFWLTALFGLIAYLLSSLSRRRRRM